LTFDWSIIDFLSCLENSVALNHISKKHHTLLRKLSHTHTHTYTHSMSWVIYLKILSARKFVLIEYLTVNYIFAYFWIAIWLSYQLIIPACSEAIFRENYCFANFPLVSNFQCGASRWTCSGIQTRATLPNVDLAIAVQTVKWHVRTRTLQV
jgi:hypothetical protein